MRRHVAVAWALALAVSAPAAAQSGASGTSTGQSTSTSQAPSSSTATATETRPATTTFFGDTGLWFVPTGEILPSGKVSVSGYRRGTNWVQGYTNVGDFAGTIGIGVKDRLELFGSFLVDTRIDRDVRPIFIPAQPTFGGVVDRYPRVNQVWTGDNVGDLYVGAKFNILSEHRQEPVAFAVRGIVKIPTADETKGIGTGKPDVGVDAILSKEAAKLVEIAGYAGFEGRGKPDGFDTPTSAFRWGGGLTVPSRSWIRVLGEVNGVVPNKDTTALTGATFFGTDGTFPPTVSPTEKITRATVGFTFQAKNGFFGGVAGSWNIPKTARDTRFSEDNEKVGTDYWDWQFRIGYHPGVKVFTPPPPPPPPPPAPAPPPEHTLTVRAECNPCTVEVGKTSTVTATVQDSINCAVTYRWSAPTGTFAQPGQRQTIWTAPMQPGTVPVTVTVTCPTDNKTASDTVNINVTAPAAPARTYTFEDVYFDFDRYSLRPDATRVLDEAVAALREDATLRVEIEGHTCNIGTAEYNLALGERRANAVKAYLVSRGIGADRLRTVSYGEERPKYDNSREETRRLNRRAAMVVNLTR